MNKNKISLNSHNKKKLQSHVIIVEKHVMLLQIIARVKKIEKNLTIIKKVMEILIITMVEGIQEGII